MYGGKSGGKGWGKSGGKGGMKGMWGMDPWTMAMLAWKGKGKGMGKGFKGKGKPSKSSVKADFEVDQDARYTGKVSKYEKWKGFGFIEMNEKGVVPDDKVFVFWKGLESEDRFPTLVPDMDVEFSLQKYRDQMSGSHLIRAKMVTATGGNKLQVQDAIDAEKKEFVGGIAQRFTGTLKYYNKMSGFGYITMDAANTFGEEVPADLRVERAEVNAGGRQPPNAKDVRVEFGVWKTREREGKARTFKAYNMTLPGGDPMTQDALDHREICNGSFSGTVEVWNWQLGYGFIKFSGQLPAGVTSKIKERAAESAKKGKEGKEDCLYFRMGDLRRGVRINQGDAVEFSCYTDDRGAGATDIHL